MESGWIPTKHVNNSNSVNTIDTENGDYGTPPPSPILSLYKPSTFPTPVCKETVALLELLLEQARSGELTGLGLVGLYRNGKYRLDLTGESKIEGNSMSVAGMLAKLQSMALDLT
jgi:hypothetical protein